MRRPDRDCGPHESGGAPVLARGRVLSRCYYMVAMGRVEWKTAGAGILVILSALGIARATLGLAGIPAGPVSMVIAALAGIAAWLLLALCLSFSSGKSWRLALRCAGWAAGPGLISWLALPLGGLLASASYLPFSQIGMLRIGGEWIAVSPENYLRLCIVGLALSGIVIAQAAIFWRNTPFPIIAAATALMLIGFWRILVFPPSGDEPYILLSTHSLIEDGDLDLRDDFAGSAPLEIHPHSFEEDFMAAHRTAGRHGESYSRHGILLPALYLPGYAVYGRLGLHALLAAAWALLLALIRRILILAGQTKALSLSVVALFAIASPLPIFGVFIGPDLPCALALALGLAALLERRVPVLLICVAVLPWIHHKAALSAAGMAMGAAVLRGPRWGAACAATLLASLALMLALLAAFTDVPTWPPWAVMNFSSANYQESFSLENVPVSLLATLFDRHQGIIHFPALLLTFGGIGLLWRDSRRLALLTCACAAPYLAALVSYSQWHGGPGAPGRLLVLILPLAALPIAAAVGSLLEKDRGRLFLRAIFVLGGLSSWILAGIPALAFVSARRRLEGALAGAVGFDPFALLPEFGTSPPSAAAYVKGLLLLALLSFLTVFMIRQAGRRSSSRRFRVTVL